MKIRNKALLVSIAITALPAWSSAQMPIGSVVSSLLTSTNQAGSPGVGSVPSGQKCLQGAVTKVEFVIDDTKFPPTYTYEYKCTWTMSGNSQTGASDVQRVSGTCAPLANAANCENGAKTAADDVCNTTCAKMH